MGIVKDIFFLIGSIFGILAFTQTFFKSAMEANRKRWAQVREVADDTDFREVQAGTWNHRVRGLNLGRIETMIHDIREDAEYLRFGPPLRRHYLEVLAELVEAHGRYRELVQVPEWEPTFASDGSEAPLDWAFNRAAFIGDRGYPDDYASHLEDATAAAANMRTVYKKLATLSDLHLWEVPVAGWIVARRVRETAEDL